MAHPQLIIDFNRHFTPNAFNTGPAIPNVLPSFRFNEIHSPSPQFGSFNRVPDSLDVPDLSTSPASTISSTSLRLEDEEIKRIFSHPRYTLSDDAFRGQQKCIPCFHKLKSSCSSDGMRRDDLNPFAVPFVPSFILTEHKLEKISNSRPHPIPVTDVRTAHLSPHSPPICPPGLAILVPNIPTGSVSEPLVAEPAKQPDPRYVPILLDCLKASATPREREALVNFIVTDTTVWDIDNLLDLAERLCDAACNPGPDFDNDGQPVPTCHFSRYLPIDEEVKECTFPKIEEFQKPEDVAIVTTELYHQLLGLYGEEIAQAFAWNVREIVLMQFIQSWDFVKPGSITYETAPPARFVRSSLYLCKTIAALFKQGLIRREHISMCISVLLKDLMSVEHTEAVYNILLGCGQSFWEPSNSEDSHPMLSPHDVLQLNCHVHDFITGLHANFMKNDLRDDMSVVGQPWTEGQLLAILAEIVDCVREWEGNLLSELRQ